MSPRGFRLGALLRARLAQEDAARVKVARAQRDADQVSELARRQGRRLAAKGVPIDGPARAAAAALVARQSLAADLAATGRLVEEAERRTAAERSALAEAAKARRGVERLAERYAAARQARERMADQRATDELAVTDRQRSQARDLGG
jgi:flagellar protein FliJ